MTAKGSAKSLEGFLGEAQEIVEAFSRQLLEIGRVPDLGTEPETINALFRSAHSLKGLAGMFGATRLGSLGHALEDLLDELRMGRVVLDGPVEGALLDAVDAFNALLGDVQAGNLAGGGKAATLADALEEKIRAARTPAPLAASKDPLEALALDPSVRGVLTEYEEHRLRENVKAGKPIYRARAAFEMASFDRGLSELSGRLKQVGEIISTLPSPGAPAGDRIAFDVLVGSSQERAALERALQGLGVELAIIERRAPVEPAPAASAPKPAAEVRPVEADRMAPARALVQTVRVDIGKLDRLMNIVGELVIAKSNLLSVAESLKSDRISAELSAQLFHEGRNLERRLEELQAGVLDVRMVPLSQVFDKLARMIRKVAHDAQKELELEVRGGEVELDKLIVEELSDPLMHLIRNAVDHGIESPEARERAGKPKKGRLTLGALQKGNHVVVEVADDGKGIDRRRVLEVAIERGLIEAAGAASLTERDVFGLLFQPGFSTAREVSELSGRGVGLDVVKTNIANLSGVIDVESEEGRGTQMLITLPVTLAILQALIVEIAGRTYAIPLSSVLEIAHVQESEVRTLQGREVVDLRQTTLPLARLSRLFRLGGEPRAAGSSYVVVVGLARERLGLLVDELLGQRDIVIKPLGRVLGTIRGIAGVTDLGQRKTVLVLDVGAILEEMLEAEPRHRQAG
ncbi:MAG: chemotaxis protein CheA [Myxococcales bacterium]